jgi:hypothetical protein
MPGTLDRVATSVTSPSVAAPPLVSDEADRRCRGAKRSRDGGTLVTRVSHSSWRGEGHSVHSRVSWFLSPANNGNHLDA